MEMLNSILARLDINSGVFTQLIVVFTLFIIAKFLFYGKLQEVLEKRKAETTGLESQADAAFEKVEALKESYENKMSGARLKAQKDFTEAKKVIIEKLEQKYQERVSIVDKRIDEARVKISEEMIIRKESLAGESQTLAKDLVEKILQ